MPFNLLTSLANLSPMVKVWLFLIELLQWARKNVPQLFSVGVIVYDSLQLRIRELEKENAMLKLQIKQMENEREVENEGKTKSDLDVINDVLNSPTPDDSSGNKPKS